MGEKFPRFGRFSPDQLALTLALSALCLLLALVGPEPKKPKRRADPPDAPHEIPPPKA